MILCNETITVFNSKLDTARDKDTYNATVITGVSWFCEIVSTVDAGLKAANKFTNRIPEDADFGGKAYATPQEYAEADDVSGLFTLRNGDIVVKGDMTGAELRPAAILKMDDSFTILGVTDNRRARAPHWKVIGA